MALIRDAEGRFRSGAVIVAFTATAVGVALALNLVLYLAGLQPTAHALDDPRMAFTSTINVISGAAATLVAWKMGQDAALVKPRLIAPGLLAGALLVTLSVGLAGLASGSISLSTCDSRLTAGLQQLAFIGPTALGEELWLRGAALRALARGTHPAFAIAGTGVVFGGLHLLNPDSSFIAAINVALVGVWFAAMAWRSQSLWPSIGAHLAWNWFEGFVWGQNVSGIKAGCSLLTATAAPPFFSGGPFGPEASGLTAVLLALASALTLAWPAKKAPNSSSG